jgi:hypothetical protein
MPIKIYKLFDTFLFQTFYLNIYLIKKLITDIEKSNNKI